MIIFNGWQSRCPNCLTSGRYNNGCGYTSLSQAVSAPLRISTAGQGEEQRFISHADSTKFARQALHGRTNLATVLCLVSLMHIYIAKINDFWLSLQLTGLLYTCCTLAKRSKFSWFTPQRLVLFRDVPIQKSLLEDRYALTQQGLTYSCPGPLQSVVRMGIFNHIKVGILKFV